MSHATSLDEALAGAMAASRNERIGWRDAIAAYGVQGIDAVFEWAGDEELGAFAVRVIEAAGRNGAMNEALSALAAVRSIGVRDSIRRDAADAMDRLRPQAAVHTVFRHADPVSRDAGKSWPGFRSEEFGDVTGTAWRRRTDTYALIPLLLGPLQDVDGDFTSYPLYRLPEVHLANRSRYEQGAEHEQGWRASKLVVYAHGKSVGIEPHVAIGFYVEKGTGADKFGPVEATLWDWPRSIELLKDSRRRDVLVRAFIKHGLCLGDYFGGRHDPKGAIVGFKGASEGAEGELVLRDHSGAPIGQGWDSLVEILEDLPVHAWHDFHIWKQWPATEAIAAGPPFAPNVLVPVLTDLAWTYLAVIANRPAGVRPAELKGAGP